MIDILTEKLLTPKQAAPLIPCHREGCATSPVTVRKLMKTGYRNAVLESVVTPGGLMTSAEAVQRFFEALNGGPQVKQSTDDDRQSRIQAARARIRAS